MQTAQYLGYCFSFVAFDNILIIIFQEYSTFLGPDAIFIIHNLVWSLFLDVFFGIYVPIKHLVLSRRHCPGLWCSRKVSSPKKNYIRTPELVPRRYSYHIGFRNGLDSIRYTNEEERQGKEPGGYQKIKFGTKKSF